MQFDRQASRQMFVERLVEQVNEQMQQVVVRCLNAALESELTALLGRAHYARRRPIRRRWRASGISCPRCHERNPQQFRRNGHYRRGLDIHVGRIELNVPQVECCRCGGQGRIPFQTLRRRQRLWDDLEQEIRRQSAFGLSLREIQRMLTAVVGGSVGLRTINQRVQQGAALGNEIPASTLTAIPPVVRVDGLWVTLLAPTGDYQLDRRGRRRPVKCGVRLPILAAEGIWPVDGRRQILAWTLGADEDRASWEALLNQLWARGVRPETGLRLLIADGSGGFEAARQTVFWDVPAQRCVFHKLRNIRRAIVLPAGLSRKAAAAYKRRLIRGAARIWRAPDRTEARRRQQKFCRRWQAEQPAVVATLCRHFEQTLTFYTVQASMADTENWPAQRLRTTSPLEREFRAWRKRLRRATVFHSVRGLTAIITQFLFRRTTELKGLFVDQWSQTLERSLARLQPIPE
jgi:transposase-like protein